jgi:signal transduction histidine kinase
MAKIISFFVRTFILILLLGGAVYGGLYMYLNKPTEQQWIRFFEVYEREVIFVAIGIACVSVVISTWMASMTFIKEFQINRQIKKLAQISRASIDEKTPKLARKSLQEVALLIDEQRKTLHRITNEKVESDEEIIRERLMEERQRLARELHDSVSQQLFAASLMLSAITEQGEEKEFIEEVERVEEMVQQAQLEMRALLLHLRPIALQNHTLVQGLRELVQELKNRTNCKIHCELDDVQLSKAQEDHLFRIAQEALSNTLRHAHALDVELVLLERQDIVLLRIQDNGVGFDMTDGKIGSYGLKNIMERAAEIGGTSHITSVVGHGTKIEVQVRKELFYD